MDFDMAIIRGQRSRGGRKTWRAVEAREGVGAKIVKRAGNFLWEVAQLAKQHLVVKVTVASIVPNQRVSC